MRASRLPAGGMNLFQQIKQKCKEAEEQGKKLYKLSIGQPSGPALLSARRAAAEAVMSDKEQMHEYQDNGSPGVRDFARRFVQAHFAMELPDNLAFLPIPGIKPMLGLVQLACNLEPTDGVGTMTKPGYPTPADWARYLGLDYYHLKLNPENRFCFGVEDIMEGTRLVMANYPHNPSGQVVSIGWWDDLCRYCSEKDIRLFNDGAYHILSHTDTSFALAEVAVNFPSLSWAEAFSASKVISNGTGWRVGAMVGSPDFIGDIATIKGNTDSGFSAPMAAGALYAIETDREGVEACRLVYENRIDLLISILKNHGMKLAVEPGAGFFTLWLCPKMAFGQKIETAEHFNFLMIEKTGIVGVHFHPYIRYAVTGDIKAMAKVIDEAFVQAQVSY